MTLRREAAQASANTSSMRPWSVWMRTRPRPEVDRGVADQVVDLLAAVLGDGEHRPARRGGDAGVGQRLLHALLGVLAEHLDEQGAGGVEELAGARGPQQPAAVEDDDVVAHPLELAEQVGGDDHGDAEVVADPLHQPEHLVPRGGVEAVGGLVEQHQLGVVGEGLGELGLLLHARGVAAHRAVALLGEADVAQHLGGPLPRRHPGQAGHHREVHDEVAGADVGRQAVVLGQVADQGPDRAALGADVVAEHLGLASGGGDEAEQDLEERGLAGAVGADQAGDAGADVDGERVEGEDRTVVLGQPVGAHHCFHAPHSSRRARVVRAADVKVRERSGVLAPARVPTWSASPSAGRASSARPSTSREGGRQRRDEGRNSAMVVRHAAGVELSPVDVEDRPADPRQDDGRTHDTLGAVGQPQRPVGSGLEHEAFDRDGPGAGAIFDDDGPGVEGRRAVHPRRRVERDVVVEPAHFGCVDPSFRLGRGGTGPRECRPPRHSATKPTRWLSG